VHGVGLRIVLMILLLLLMLQVLRIVIVWMGECMTVLIRTIISRIIIDIVVITAIAADTRCRLGLIVIVVVVIVALVVVSCMSLVQEAMTFALGM
jgi:hypothetical protein